MLKLVTFVQDCGWMGMRASVGVCLHCMYHVDSPFPVQNCPQCMENDANYSDEEWTPQTASDLQLGNRRRNLVCFYHQILASKIK